MTGSEARHRSRIDRKAVDSPAARASEQDDEPQDNEQACGLDPAKAYRLLIFVHMGLTQKQIAERFGVTDRTIRNWTKDPTYKNLTVLSHLRVTREVTRRLAWLEARDHEFAKWQHEAESRGELTTAVAVGRERLKLERDRTAFLERCGLYRNIAQHLPAEEDPGAAQAEFLTGLMDDLRNPEDGGDGRCLH